VMRAFLILAVAAAASTSWAGDDDALARAVAAPQKVSYKGTKIVQMVLAGRPTEVRAKVFHRKPDRTRTVCIAPPSVAGMVVLDIGEDRWQYSPTRRRWEKTRHSHRDEHLALTRQNYRAQSLLEGTVAGRPAAAISLTPRTPGDPSKVIWVDKKFDLILSSESRSASRQVTSRFVEIEFNPPHLPDSLFRPPQVMAQSSEQPFKRPPFTVVIPGYVPKGYVLAETSVLRVGSSCAVHLKYTNGVNTISVFERVEARSADTPPNRIQKPKNSPGPEMVKWQSRGLEFMVMGDVSRSELNKIAESARK